MELILYSTDNCSLCDEALELIFSMPELAGHSVRVVDVALDEQLLDTFGERLPVLEFQTGDSAERLLDWPFDSQTVRGVLATVKSS
jgi:hypothetical protein